MDVLLKFGELFQHDDQPLEIIGTKLATDEHNFCEHCGKKVKRLLIFRDPVTNKIIKYGVNHAAEILNYDMKEFNRIIHKANRAMWLRFFPACKEHRLYPYLRNAKSKTDRALYLKQMLKELEKPNFFLPDIKTKGL